MQAAAVFDPFLGGVIFPQAENVVPTFSEKMGWKWMETGQKRIRRGDPRECLIYQANLGNNEISSERN